MNISNLFRRIFMIAVGFMGLTCSYHFTHAMDDEPFGFRVRSGSINDLPISQNEKDFFTALKEQNPTVHYENVGRGTSIIFGICINAERFLKEDKIILIR